MQPWLARARPPRRPRGFSVAAAAVVWPRGDNRRALPAPLAVSAIGQAGRLRRARGWRFAARSAPVAESRPLFQHGDTGVQPVAIAVQGIDGGGQPPRLVLAFLGDRLESAAPAAPDRPPRSGRAAIRSTTGWPAPPRPPRRPRQRPTIPAATASGGRIVPPRPKSRTARPPVFSVSKLPAKWSESLAMRRFGPPEPRPNHATNINRKCAWVLESPLGRGESGFHSG